MEFNELLDKRRSVRKYQEKKVSVDLVDKIIDDSTKAPNAGNNQPWKFIVIRDKELIMEMSDDSKAVLLADIRNNPNSAFKVYEKPLQNPKFNVFYNAPCLICIVGQKSIATIAADCALAASYLMLSATSLGLGTCWVELGKQIRDPNLLKRIKLPEGHQIYAPVIIGYPENIPVIPERKEPEIIYI